MRLLGLDETLLSESSQSGGGGVCRGRGWKADTFSKSQQRGKNKNSGGSQRKGHRLCGDVCQEMGNSGGRGVGRLGKILPHRDGGAGFQAGDLKGKVWRQVNSELGENGLFSSGWEAGSGWSTVVTS